MARKIWKLGKFDKGINSHTDPKDIDSSEWAELDDVNVSKVGVAKLLGKPISDKSVSTTKTGELIGGKGLYRFSSDNAFLPALVEGNQHVISNTIDGGGGSRSEASFSIDSLVWLFNSKPANDSTTTLTFQLTVGGTPIMDAMTVISGNLPQNTQDSTVTTTNILDDNDYLHEDDLIFNGNMNEQKSVYTNIPHQLCKLSTLSDTLTTDGDVQYNSTGYNASLFWKQSNSDLNNAEFNNNLNQDVLPFSATYNLTYNNGDGASDSGTYPNGDKSFHNHYMLGFYNWDGYRDDVLADGGFTFSGWEQIENEDFSPAVLNTSGFSVPLYKVFGDNNYKRAKLSFASHLIRAINSYSGSGANDYTAKFEDHDSTENGAFHQTTEDDDSIYIQCANNIAATQDGNGDSKIEALIRCSAAGGSTFVTGSHLLSDEDTYGYGYGYNSDNEWEVPTTVNDLHVSDSSGGSMVISGDTEVISGSPEDVYEKWKITIRGNPNSGKLINIILSGNQGVDSDNIDIPLLLQLEAKWSSNQEFCHAIMMQLRVLTDIAPLNDPTYYYVIHTSITNESSNYPSDEIEPYSFEISTNLVGTEGAFNVELYWTESNDNIVSSTGVDDEQLVLVSKSDKNFSLNSSSVKATDLKIWSNASYTWLSSFSNIFLDTIQNNDTSKYLNWFHTSDYDNDPVFYDEGNVLRISESNFDLLQKLESIFESESIYDNVNNNPNGYMWANPSQWFGYKDTSNFYKDRDNLDTLIAPLKSTTGFFIGKQSKTWNYTKRNNPIDNTTIDGLSLVNSIGYSSSNPVFSNEENFDTNSKGLKIHTKVSNEGNGTDWVGNIRIYAVSCYDDNSESLPGHKFDTELSFGTVNGVEDGDSLTIQFVYRPYDSSGNHLFNDARINGIRLYYTDSEEGHANFWNLGKIDFNLGFIKAATISTLAETSGNETGYKWKNVVKAGMSSSNGDTDITVSNSTIEYSGYDATGNLSTIIEYTEKPKTEQYEDLTDHSPFNDTISVDYKSVCIAGRRAFVGNIRVWNGSFYEYYNDRMVVSPVNSLDIFPYPDNILDLEISDGDKIIALAAFGDKVIQYKQKTTYIMNISTGLAKDFFVEERHKWKGILNKSHFCSTDKGVFWINNRGAWIYDGEEIKDLFIREDSESSQQSISSEEWSNFITDETIIGYNAPSREILIVKKHTHKTPSDSDCFVYSLVVNSWTKGIKRFYSGANKSMTNMQSISTSGKILYLIEESASEPLVDGYIVGRR